MSWQLYKVMMLPYKAKQLLINFLPLKNKLQKTLITQHEKIRIEVPKIKQKPHTTFVVNLALSKEDIHKETITQLKQVLESTDPISKTVNLVILTKSQKAYIIEVVDHESKEKTLQSISNTINILLQKKLSDLDTFFTDKITKSEQVYDPKMEKTLVMLIDVSKPQEETIQKMRTTLATYSENTTWENADIIFIYNQKTTLFQISRSKQSYPLTETTNKLTHFLEAHYETIKKYLSVIQREKFHQIEYLDIKTKLEHSFQPGWRS